MTAEQPPLIGIVDTAPGRHQPDAGAAFVITDGHLWQRELAAGRACASHGERVADIILAQAPAVRLAVADVFQQAAGTSALQVAAAIDWLVAQGARLINLSLGLRLDRPRLRDACERASAAGVMLVASAPAQGAPVYPAAYACVIRATGDARCDHRQWSYLHSRQADFGACVRPLSEAVGTSGASMGCAHISGHLARYLSDHPQAGRDDALQWLIASAVWQGREIRHG